MDFKAALQAEIEAKRRQFEKISNGTEKKSVKVADLEKQRQEEYSEKQRLLEEQRQVKFTLIINFFYYFFNFFLFLIEKIR